MKCSLEELYIEVYSLREKVAASEIKEKSLIERESNLAEKEKSIAAQLEQQKIIFEEYNSRIKALHQTVESYERRQKDLVAQLGQKDETISGLTAANNRLKIDVTEAKVVSNLLETQAHKVSVYVEEECGKMLTTLGSTEIAEGVETIKLLSKKVDQVAK